MIRVLLLLSIAVASLSVEMTAGSRLFALSQEDGKSTEFASDALLRRERMIRWLAERQLWQRQLEFLESELAVETDPEQRLQLAGQLATRYAVELDRSGNRSNAAHLREQSQRLQELFPRLESPRLEVALLQAEYGEAVVQFEAAWEQPDRGLASQVVTWRELVDGLTRFTERSRQRSDELAESRRLSGESANETATVLEREYEAAFLKASYLRGWALYFSALVFPAESAARLAEADRSFRNFFQIAAGKPVDEIRKGWFNWPSGWTGLGLVGWASVLELAGRTDSADHLFRLVQANDRRQSPWARRLFLFKSAARAGNWERAGQALQEAVEEEAIDSDEPAFWDSVFRFSVGMDDSAAEPRYRFQRLALLGLTRQFKSSWLKALSQDFDLKITGNDFLSGWLRGYLAALTATGQPDWQRARKELAEALRKSRPSDKRSDLARCRLLLGQVELRLGAFDSAARELAVAVPDLKEEPEWAAEALWFQAQAILQSNPRDQRSLNRAIPVFDELILQFPESRWAREARLEKERWEARYLPPAEALRRLGEISRDDPNWPAAQLESIRIQHAVCQDSAAGDAAEREKLAAMEQELRNDPRVVPESKFQALLWRIDVERRVAAPHPGPLDELLRAATGLVNSLPADSLLLAEWDYQRFQVLREGWPRLAAALADRVADRKWGDSREVSALIYLVQLTNPGRAAAPQGIPWQQRSEWLQRLVEIWGDSPEALLNDPNARIAYTRLAECESWLGNYESAEKRLERLWELFPDQAQILIGLARCYNRQKRWREARPLWSRLARGSEPGSDSWFEAKLGLIECLGALDLPAARQLYQQTLRLSPGMPGGWADRFERLPAKIREVPSSTSASGP